MKREVFLFSNGEIMIKKMFFFIFCLRVILFSTSCQAFDCLLACFCPPSYSESETSLTLRYKSKYPDKEEAKPLISLIPPKSLYQKNLYGLTRAVSPLPYLRHSPSYQNLSAHCLDGFDAKILPDSFIVAGLGGGGGLKNIQDTFVKRAQAEMAYKAPKEMNEYILKYFCRDKSFYGNDLLTQEIATRWIKSIREKLSSGFNRVGEELQKSKEYQVHQATTTLLSIAAFPYKQDNKINYHVEGFNFGNSLALYYSPAQQKFKTISSSVMKQKEKAPIQYPSHYLEKQDNYRPFTITATPGDFIILCSYNVVDYLPHKVQEMGVDSIVELKDPKISQYLYNKLKNQEKTSKNIANFLVNYNTSANLTDEDFTLMVIQLPVWEERQKEIRIAK